MTALAALQRAFQRHVYRPRGAMERHVVAGPRAGAARRLGVYVSAYRARLVEALAEDYPALRVQLGERRFDELMREFIAAHPSVFPNLRWYGGELARFMARSARWRRPALLAELARFEWALGLAFDAADAPLARESDLARVPAGEWPGLRFCLHPSACRLSLRSNAPEIWRAAIRKSGRATPRLRRHAAEWLVWRKGFEPFYRPLARDEAWALGAIARGRDFASVCAGLRTFVGSVRAALQAAQYLRNWMTEGLISELRRTSR